MYLSKELLNTKIKKVIEDVKEQRFDQLESELYELGELFLKEKEQFVTNAELKLLIEEMKKGFEIQEIRFQEIHKRFEDLLKYTDKRFEDLLKYTDKRFEDINSRFEDMNKRFEDINRRFEDMNQRFEDMNKRFEDMNQRFDDINKRFNFIQWLIIILSGSLLTLIFYFHDKTMDAFNDFKINMQKTLEIVEKQIK